MKGQLAKSFFAFAAVLLLVVAPAGATTLVTMDGVWWQGLAQGEKIAAIQGLLAGLGSGFDSGRGSGWFEAVHTFKVPLSVEEAAFQKFVNAQPPDRPQFSKTFGTYIDEINLFYEVHPKRTSVTPANLLGYCFPDKPSFPKGSTCDDFGSAFDK